MSNLAFWKQFIASNLKHNIDNLVRDSIKDFHFKGLNYICFQFSPSLTIRLYVIEPSQPVDTTLVNRHNHLYDSQILVLTGSLVNNVYEKVEGETFNHYHLTSALCPTNTTGKILLESLGKCDLRLNEIVFLKPGDTHFQDSEEIHNVENDTSVLTSFLVFEYPTVKEHSILFSVKDYGTTIPTPDCYNRFTAEEITGILGRVLEQL